MRQQITVLGATGSIGVSTLDVISQHTDKYSVFALTGNQLFNGKVLQVSSSTP